MLKVALRDPTVALLRELLAGLGEPNDKVSVHACQHLEVSTDSPLLNEGRISIVGLSESELNNIEQERKTYANH